jgi:hypothetical protein
MPSMTGRSKYRRAKPDIQRLQELAEEVAEPIVPWRDFPHRGIMASGLCLLCFGWCDDPRHSGAELLDGRAAAASLDFRYTVFRKCLPA